MGATRQSPPAGPAVLFPAIKRENTSQFESQIMPDKDFMPPTATVESAKEKELLKKQPDKKVDEMQKMEESKI